MYKIGEFSKIVDNIAYEKNHFNYIKSNVEYPKININSIKIFDIEKFVKKYNTKPLSKTDNKEKNSNSSKNDPDIDELLKDIDKKIAELENKIRYAKIIDESEIDTKTVQVGNTVKLLDLEFDEEVSYTIVGSTEVDIAQNKISNESPIGSAILGAKKNQVVEVQAPAGVMQYKVLSITK